MNIIIIITLNEEPNGIVLYIFKEDIKTLLNSGILMKEIVKLFVINYYIIFYN